MPIWTQEIPHRRKGKRKVHISVAPAGESFDVWSLLEEHDEVRLTTIDSNLIKLTKTSRTTLHSERNIVSGLDIAVECYGMKKIFDGWCRRDGTIWKRIDPLRMGLYWRFGHSERDATRPLQLGQGFVHIRHISPQPQG